MTAASVSSKGRYLWVKHSRTSTAGLAALSMAGLFVCCVAASVLRGAQEPVEAPAAGAESEEPAEMTSAGLRGILPAEVPRRLEPEEFEILGGNWSEWSRELAQLVRKLYEDPELDAAAQRQLIETLRSKLGVMQRALGDRRYRSIHDPLTTIHGRLLRRVDLAEAALDTLELTPEKVRGERLEDAGREVVDALERLRQRLGTIRGGSGWLPYVRADELEELMQSPADAEAARPVLQSVHDRLTGTEEMTDRQQQFLSRDEFVALRVAIEGYLRRADEELPAVDTEKLREELAGLVASVEVYELDGKSSASRDIQERLGALEELALDAGQAVTEVVDRHYRSDNLRIVASEEVLSRYVAETRRESEGISEPTDGAYSTGTQTTTATTGVDLLPREQGARFDLVLRGVVRTSTVSQASRATIYASGNHTFVARRAVVFDGEDFRLGPYGVISVNPNITITGATTSYEGGLFAGTARRRAMSTARSRVPSSERRTARKIRERVLPEFEEEVEQEFSKANKELDDKWRQRLRETELEPASRDLSSTNTHLFWNSLVAREGELSGGTTIFPPAPEEGLTIHVHESLLNRMFDRMDIAGRAMTEAQFRQVVDDYITKLTGREQQPDESEEPKDESNDLYVFAEEDPVRFHIENGVVNLVIRTGFREEGEEEIPTQQVSVPLTFRVEPDQIVIERGRVGVAPVERPESRFKQIARAAEMRDRIEKAIQPKPRERNIDIAREGRDDLVLYVTKISPLNGWISVWAR